jgi:hypothetical protein
VSVQARQTDLVPTIQFRFFARSRRQARHPGLTPEVWTGRPFMSWSILQKNQEREEKLEIWVAISQIPLVIIFIARGMWCF